MNEYHPHVLLGLAAVWVSVLLFGLWTSRTRHRWQVRVAITASLLVFLAGWMFTSPLTRLIGEAIISLSYPANRHYFARETGLAACAIILAASNVVGIAGIWASLGRPHWFMRVLVIAAIPPLLLLVRAYEPCFVFFVQSVVTAVPLVIARKIRGWEPFGRPTTLPVRRDGYTRLQFGILDLLTLTLLVATVLGVVVSSPEEFVVHEIRHRGFTMFLPSPPSHVLMGTLGVALGLVMLLAAWVTLSGGVWWLRVMGLFLAWPGLLCMLWLGLWREATGRHFRMQPGWAADGCGRAFASQRRAFGLAGIILLSLFLLVPLGVVYYHLAVPLPIPGVAIPEPNGYDDLLAAGETLERTLRDQGTLLPALWKEPSASEVNACRILNRTIWNTTLERLRAAIDRPSCVPFHYRAIEYGRYEYMDDLASALKIEGQAAASEGRIPDAVRCFTEMIRLGPIPFNSA